MRSSTARTAYWRSRMSSSECVIRTNPVNLPVGAASRSFDFSLEIEIPATAKRIRVTWNQGERARYFSDCRCVSVRQHTTFSSRRRSNVKKVTPNVTRI